MKAAIRKRYGPPESISVVDTDIPRPRPNEILIKVCACTVNRTDCAILTGKPWIMRLFTGLINPKIPATGTDFSGIISDTGAQVREFKTGQEVYGFFDQGLGSHASYFCVSDDKAISILPGDLSHDEAAASLEGAHYAYYFIHKLKLKPGQNALVNGATGAIGSALLQMIKHEGLKVTAVCDQAHFDQIQSYGADHLIDYTKEDFTKSGETYDFVFDAVGKSSFPKCRHILTEKGIYISSELGSWNQNPLFALTTALMGGKKVIFPIPGDIKKSMQYVSGLIQKNAFRPLIDRKYPLEKISEAFQYVASGKKIGNVLIRFENS
jgi:NADPH:quinone reductase-like Zn-dependent oxidoreductase